MLNQLDNAFFNIPLDEDDTSYFTRMPYNGPVEVNTKKKRRPKKSKHKRKKHNGKYYAVAVGRKRSVFRNWTDCEKQVKGYSGAIYKSFTNRKQAWKFVRSYRKRWEREQKLDKERKLNSIKPLNPKYVEKAMKLSPYQSVDKADIFDIEMFLADKIDNQVSTYGYVVVDPVLSKSDKPELTYYTGSVKDITKLEIQLIGLINFLENNLMYKDSYITLEFNNDYLYYLFALNWLGKWEQSGFKKSNGEPIKFKDKIKRIVELVKPYRHLKVRRVPQDAYKYKIRSKIDKANKAFRLALKGK